MGFELDKQTISDLEIFGDERSSHSIFSLYNGTKTSGGKDRLYTLMRNPLDDPEQLQSRRDAIRFFYDNEIALKISSNQFDFIEHYLRLNVPTLRNNILDASFQVF